MTTALVDAPARVDGVQLFGEMVGSGYRTPPSLVRRSDGQVLQLTPLLYLVLSAADGRRSCAEIADVVGRVLSRRVTDTDVRTLVDGHLRPLGLLRLADGSAPELKRSNPLLALKLKLAITDPRTTHRLTDPFRVLFRPVVAAAVVVGFAAVVCWVFFERGLGASAYDAFDRPHLLLLVFVVTVLSGGFHEFGHAAAARYSGAEPGVMGAGLYLVWPAFYTDVTDSYRLGRAGRIRTDLGGLYFNAIVVVLTFVWWWTTGWEALLLLVATQVLQMTQQLLPLLRFDGYHLLADLAGVPDLYHRIRPTLLGLLPHRWRSPENHALKPWARALITVWVLVTVPMMAMMLLALVSAVPRLLGSAGSVVRADVTALADAWRAGGLIDVTAHALQVLAVVLPLLASALILGRMGVRWFGGLARWSHGSGLKRVLAAVLSAMLVTGLSWAWWPNPGTYRPIEPGERGLFTTLWQSGQAEPTAGLARPAAGMLARPGGLPVGAAAEQRLSSGQPLVAMLEEGQAVPTKDDPVLAMVLVPVSEAGPDQLPSAIAGGTAPTAPASTPARGADAGSSGAAPDAGVPSATPAEPWVFPFDAPLAPEEGDNQALAVATADGSVTYDVAFALVWADGDEVLNVNEAHAYASCSDCVAVAVAFQVVLIMDDAQVVVPQNLAVAANYDCYRCITAAIASQLVLSMQEEPAAEELRALGEVWSRLVELAHSITTLSLTQISDQLEAFKDEIVAILGEAPVVVQSPSEASSSPAGSTTTPAPGATTTTDPTTTTPAPGATTTADPAATPSPGTATTVDPAATPAPGATTTPDPTTTTSTPAPDPTTSPSPATDPTTSPAPIGESTTAPAPSPSP